MCSQPPKNIDDSWIVDDVLAAIPLIDPSTQEIRFTGGEATLLGDDFFRILCAMRTYLPKTAIHILSNGRLFAAPEFAKRYADVRHSDIMVGIPIYSDVSTIHDYVVQSDGAFDETIRGILNLKRLCTVVVQLKRRRERTKFLPRAPSHFGSAEANLKGLRCPQVTHAIGRAHISLMVLQSMCNTSFHHVVILLPTPSESPFEVKIGFPVWIPFPEGNVGARVPFTTEGVDRVEAHIRPFNNLGAFGYIIPLSIELQKCRWLVQVSGYYLNLSTTVHPRGPLFQSGNLDWNSGLIDVAVGYRVIERDPFSFDLLAGGRYQHVGLDFSLQPRANHLLPRSASDSKDWADPFVRVVGKARLARPVTLFLKGDVGGFGVSSDITWTVYGGLEFQIARHFYADVGCRYFGTDYSVGSFKYDVTLIGPQIELGINF